MDELYKERPLPWKFDPGWMSVNSADYETVITSDERFTENEEASSALGYLIAAAPDMYEALEHILYTIDMLPKAEFNKGLIRGVVTSALFKAKGL